MRLAFAAALSLILASVAFAQQPASKAEKKKASPRPNPVVQSYAAIPLNERVAIQSDLVWVGDYNGVANGEFGDRAIAAVRAFQSRNGTKQTGVLNPQERAVLAGAAKAKQEAAGWRMVDDAASGARLGIPAKFAPQSERALTGSRWASARGEVQVETFRLRNAGALPAVFEQQKKSLPQRKVSYQVLRPDFFVIAGLQGLKKFYVRAHARDNEVRGMTVLYDQAMEGTMDPIVVAMSSAFTPFPAGQLAGPPPRRKVDYGTGIPVSASGHVLADREVVDGCHVIALPGLGNAELVAQDKAAELALLRVYGARALKPVALAGEPPGAGEITLAGIADPQAQAGGQAVSLVRARLGAASDAGALLMPAPAPGFGGAAALDAQGRLIGMASLKNAEAPRAVLVSAAIARKFLAAHGVDPSSSAAGADATKAALLRVICVRK